MAKYTVEFYDYDRSELAMSGATSSLTQDAMSPLDAVVKATREANENTTEVSCCDGEVIATAYTVEPGVFEYHLYAGDTDTAFTLSE